MDNLRLNPVVDPELEEVRNQVPGPQEITDDCFNKWLAKGSQYSLRRLTFQNQVGWEILHKVAWFIDGTLVGSNGDWKQMAGFLGLHINEIRRIENFSSIKGATLEILSLYALQQDAKLSKLLEALRTFDRQDVLLAIAGKLEELFNPSAMSDSCRSSSDLDSEMDSGMEVNIDGFEDSGNLKSIPLKSSASLSISQKSVALDQKKCTKTVFLTFAQDGYDLAKQVARQIRSLNLGIGVLILEENREELDISGEMSIYRWYYEVDYIIPIITEGYLWNIAPRADDNDQSEPTCIDAQYARLIYVMMLEEFQRNRSLNYRVRPIESDMLDKKRSSKFLLLAPIFRCRRQLDQVEKLASTLAAAEPRVMIR